MSAKKWAIDHCVCGGQAHLIFSESGCSVRCEFDPGLASAPEFTTEKKAVISWNKRQREMDEGDIDAVRAYHSGLSYGAYMANKPQTPPAVRFPKRALGNVKEERCLQCGMYIPASTRSTKYCCVVCADAYREEQKKIRARLGRQEYQRLHAPKCEICGDLILPGTRRKKYCGEQCARIALKRQQQIAHAIAKESQGSLIYHRKARK